MEKYLLGQIDGTEYGTTTDTPEQKILALAKELQEIKGDTKESWENAVLKNYWNFMSCHLHKLKNKYIEHLDGMGMQC